jgi:VanZ family protein
LEFELTFSHCSKVQAFLALGWLSGPVQPFVNPYQATPSKIRLVGHDGGARLNVRRWLPPLLWAGVILFGTSLPQEAVPVQTAKVDKILHFSIYTVFSYLLTRQISEITTRWRAAAIAVVFAMVFGALDEWHQRFIPGRSTEFADWRADAFGAVVGALICVATLRRRSPQPTIIG